MTVTDAEGSTRRVPAEWLLTSVRKIFSSLGLSEPAARSVATALVDADLRGVSSHGSMLVPMYVDRIQAGSVSLAESADVLVDRAAIGVLDGRGALGQLTSDQAMSMAIEKAKRHGIGAVAVRHAFHFGCASRYAEQAAAAGCIGIAAANTRPLMPAPGGARPVVGNNPIAFAAPREDAEPIVLDMALSEAALGKIRLAESDGRTIPVTWATDKDGGPTTDPTAALAGMLLPAAGHKGFGLALAVDILTGVLSGGAFGGAVRGLYADVSVPNDCAHFFLALHPAAFGVEDLPERVSRLAREVHCSPTAPGTDRVLVPGQPESERHKKALEQGVTVQSSVLAGVWRVAEEIGAELPPLPAEGAGRSATNEPRRTHATADTQEDQ
ncbi:MAG: Ldh family oxidoreductase [Nocardioidaceae bacterium]